MLNINRRLPRGITIVRLAVYYELLLHRNPYQHKILYRVCSVPIGLIFYRERAS
jgi:hypothetical protein